jgi:hypothetical protein
VAKTGKEDYCISGSPESVWEPVFANQEGARKKLVPSSSNLSHVAGRAKSKLG